MFWASVSAAVVISLSVCLLYGALLRRRLRNRSGIEPLTENLRKEVDNLVLELNSTTERNIALLENRINALKEMLDQARKTAGVLRREQEQHHLASQVYTHLEQAASRNTPLNLKVEEKENETPQSVVEKNPSQPAPEEGTEVPDMQSMTVREKVILQYSRGENVDAISQTLGISPGEVELIISLHRRRSL